MTQISKWLSLCLIAMLAFTVNSFAQEEETEEDPVVVYDPDDVDGVRGFSTSKLVIGGNVNFWIANAVFFELSPFVSYRITDKWLAGVGMNYSSIMARNVGVPYVYETPSYPGEFFQGTYGAEIYRERFVGGRLLTRYLLFHINDPAGIYATAEFQYNRKSIKLDDTRIPRDRMLELDNFPYPVEFQIQNDAIPSMYFGGGYTSNYYQGFGYTLELMYDVLWKSDNSFNEFPFTYRVGFTYGF